VKRLLPLLTTTLACGSGGESIRTYTVRDSAGIEIVENTDAAWTSRTAWPPYTA
jgi:hypothetical protein